MQTKEFCMWQVRRYDPASLVQCLRDFGWEPIGQIPFSGSRARPHKLRSCSKSDMPGREVVRHEAAALLIYTGSMLKRTWPIPRKYTSNDSWKLEAADP